MKDNSETADRVVDAAFDAEVAVAAAPDRLVVYDNDLLRRAFRLQTFRPLQKQPLKLAELVTNVDTVLIFLNFHAFALDFFVLYCCDPIFLCIFAVIKQPHKIIKHMKNNCFISLDPNSPGGYPASCWYNNAYKYNSLDTATSNQYIASGGEFWCIDDASIPNNDTTCYRKETVSIKPIDCVVNIQSFFASGGSPCAAPDTIPLFNTHTVPLVPNCLIP